MRKLTSLHERFALRKPFTISRGTVDAVDVVTVEISDNGVMGRGECRPYPRYDETVESVRAEIEEQRLLIEKGGSRQDLVKRLPGGAARNAIDCALWDLEAKASGQPVHQLAGLEPPVPCFATYTLGLDSPSAMAREAADVKKPILKLKLGCEEGDDERVQAVHSAAPGSRLIIDANEGWNMAQLERYMPTLVGCEVEMIEQPLPAGKDAELEGFSSPVMLCADESCHEAGDVKALANRYGMVNIKLDKAGGLSGAIELMDVAKQHDLRIMIGCMMASSLSMAPAQLIASAADYVDLDAPLLLKEDRDPPIEFDGALMLPASPALWGA